MSVRRRGLPALMLVVVLAALAGRPDAQAAAHQSAEAAVTVSIQGVGSVLIEPSHVTCDATCSTSVVQGTAVTVTADAADGFVLASWHGACAGTDGDTCVIHPDSDASITVVFAAAAVTATTTAGSNPTPTTTVETTPPPPTTTAPPPPPPIRTMPSNAADVVSNAVRELPTAFVAFNVPTTLGRNETATIQLLLSPPSKSIAELKDRLSEAGDRIGDRVKYSSTMEATLLSQDFDITPVDNESRKFVPADEVTEWLWQVTPKRTGKLRLYLNLYAIIDVAGKEGPVKVGTFHRTLSINVTWTQRAGDFVKSNWQWLWTAILVPVGLWAAGRRKRPKPPAPASSDAATST
jgi:Divergent InlB B-repeat domain